MSDEETGALLEQAYDAMQDGVIAGDYHERHDINSACILTVYDDDTAGMIAEVREADRRPGRVHEQGL